MKFNHYAPGKVNPHLPHDALEIEPVTTDTESAQREADLLVSQLMLGGQKPAEKVTPATSVRDQLAPTQKAAPKPAAPTHPVEMRPVEMRDETLVKKELRDAFAPLNEDPEPTFFEKVPPVYFVAFACGALVVVWPTLIFWSLVATVLMLVTFALILKLPGVVPAGAYLWGRFANLNPHRAERVRKVADRAAMMLERGLDMLPGSLADRLALPDFSQPVAPKR